MTPAVLLAGLIAAQEAQQDRGAPSPPPPDAIVANPVERANVVVPALHNLVLMSVMRATESYLWPDSFSKTQHFGAHCEEAFTKAPRAVPDPLGEVERLAGAPC